MVNVAGLCLVAALASGQAEGVPESAREALGKHVGNWVGEWTYGDGKGRNRLSVKWSPDKHCTIANLEVRGQVEGEEIRARGVILAGWDPARNQIVGTHFGSGGVTVSNHWTIESPMLQVGTSRWVEADGSVSEGKCRLEFHSADEFTVTNYDRKGKDREFPKLEIRYKRVPSAATRSGSDQAQQSKSLAAVMNPFLGTWMLDYTLDEDVPGFASTGTAVKASYVLEMTNNGNAVATSSDWILGDKRHHYLDGVIVWDPTKQGLSGIDSYSNGGIARYNGKRDGRTLMFEVSGMLADGTPTSFDYRLELSPDGKQLISRFTNWREGDKKLDDMELVSTKQE